MNILDLVNQIPVEIIYILLGVPVIYLIFVGQRQRYKLNMLLEDSLVSMKKQTRTREEDLNIQKRLLKLNEDTNRHLSAVVNELKRSNRFLSDIAALEPIEDNMVQPGSVSSSSFSVSTPASVSSVSPESVSSTLSDSENFDEENSQVLDNQSSGNQFKLYVGNIDYGATEAELADYFSGYGTVESVNIPVNRYTGKTRGFGFVSFGSREEAERAMELHGSEFKGRQIQVNFAKERD